MNLSELLTLSDSALKRACKYPSRRALFTHLSSMKGKHYVGIVGPRGAGKTILLLQLALEMEDCFYLSLDTLDKEADLFGLIERLVGEYKFKNFFLDEIHFHKNPTGFLKKAYDFLDVKIYFTSSVALQMRATAYDLSRRVLLYELRYLSFREFLKIKYGQELRMLSLDDLLNANISSEHLRSHARWSEYINSGLLPFALEEPNALPLLRNIVQTVIRSDIPSLHPLMIAEIETIEKLLKFVGMSGVDGINYSTLSNNLGITKYKAEQYLSLLENAYLVQRLFPVGTNVMKEPKVLLTPPVRLLYRELDDSIGSLREDLAVSMLRPGVEELHYLKASRGSKTPDFMILYRGEKIVFEVGGANKGRKQFKGITADRKIILRDGGELSKESVPLHCLGFLAQFEDELPNAEDKLDEDYLSLVSRNLEEWESDDDEEFGKSL